MNKIKYFFTFILGAGAGLLAGVLTAPRSGKKTRKKLANELDSTKKALEEAASAKLDEAKDLLNQTVEDQAKKGKEVINKVKDQIKINQ